MDFLENPEDMTPEERLQELAAIFALGYTRYKNQVSELAAATTNPPNSVEKPLDVSGHPSSCLDNGLTDRDSMQKRAGE